jgi:hypothetical protein
MDEFIQVDNDVRMQIFYNLKGKLATNLLNCIYVLISLSLQLILQNTCLHFIVVLKKVIHSCVNKFFLGLQFLIKFYPHPSQKTIDILSSLYFNTLRTAAEVAVAVFFIQLLAPFCEDPQNLRIFYLDVSIFDLSWRKQRCIF